MRTKRSLLIVMLMSPIASIPVSSLEVLQSERARGINLLPLIQSHHHPRRTSNSGTSISSSCIYVYMCYQHTLYIVINRINIYTYLTTLYYHDNHEDYLSLSSLYNDESSVAMPRLSSIEVSDFFNDIPLITLILLLLGVACADAAVALAAAATAV